MDDFRTVKKPGLLYRQPDDVLCGNFIFRNIKREEAGQAASIEEICFPPNEACSKEMMYERIEKAPDFFLVAQDKDTGKIAGFLSGLATDEELFRDEFFKDANMHNPNGRNIMLLGLDVLPAYRRKGLARELMRCYLVRERDNNRHTVILTCLDAKVNMYEKMGFTDEGMSASTWGGEQWHEMRYILN